MAHKRRDAAKERFWRDLVQRHRGSGLSVAEFCRREKLSQPSFYAWRRTLAERDSQRAKPATRRQPRREFLPLRVTDSPARQGAITIELAGGRLLRLPESIAAGRLAEVVQALEARTVEARTPEAHSLRAQALVAESTR